ncbi:hypothetical protein AGMMS49975_02320 [Clostridia bacterium]|nr:hypothetical protein AGMMS49975_02320 [Clostridia bacterium]
MSPFFAGLLVSVVVFCTLNQLLELRFFADTRKFFNELFDSLWGHLERYNRKRRSERIKRENIVRQKENLIVKYNRLIDEFLHSFNMSFTIEMATSLIAAVFAILVIISSMFLKDITISFILTVSIMIALFTWFSIESRRKRAARAESIADAEDAICPLARDGVLIAVKKVMETEEYIDEDIRPYFREFIDNCETRGYSFRQAMTQLNRHLGARFDNFAEKAIIFEYNERKGMADIFHDIVDENAVVREMNTKKEDMFKRMDRDFLMKTLLIILFFIYALSVPEFRDFMLNTTAGKFINSLCVNIICISFAWGQHLQGSLELKRQKPKG